MNESKSGKVVGKISFIDLAGSERGADTTDNDLQVKRGICSKRWWVLLLKSLVYDLLLLK